MQYFTVEVSLAFHVVLKAVEYLAAAYIFLRGLLGVGYEFVGWLLVKMGVADRDEE